MLRNRKLTGFTLIELLVVVLVLAILMAVALPLYLSAVADSQYKTCHANMQTIANAVAAARIKAGDPDYTNLITANTAAIVPASIPDLAKAPICPNGGSYALAAGTVTGSFKVTCTGSSNGTAHGSFEPGVDSK